MNKKDSAPDALRHLGMFRSDEALTDAQIQRYAPAALTRQTEYKAGHEGLSTVDIINALRKEGFPLCQTTCREVQRNGMPSGYSLSA